MTIQSFPNGLDVVAPSVTFNGVSLPSPNVLINGDFAIDQYNNGAAVTVVAGAAKAYVIDRHYAYCTGANVTGQQVAGSAQSQFRYRFTGAASNTAIQFGQRIEAANSYHLNGKTCTLSVDLANSLLTTVTWTAYYANTTNTFGTIASPTRTLIATGTFPVTSTITRYSTQISVPSAATTGIEVVLSVANQTSGTWTIGDMQFEQGSVATPFERRDDLSACIERLEVIDGTGTFAFSPSGGMAFVATNRIANEAPISTIFFSRKKGIPAISFPTGAGQARYVGSNGIVTGLTPSANAVKLNSFVLSVNTLPVSIGYGWIDNVGNIFIESEL